MRAKFLLIPTISVLGLGSLLLASPSFAQDDVYVNFSVLDSLGENNSPVINDGPLFPIVKPVVLPAAKINPAKKIQAKKPSSPKAEKVNIPAKQDVNVEVKLKEQAPKIVKPKVEGLSASDLKDSPFAVSAEVPVKDEVLSAPIVPIEVKTEELPEIKAPVISAPIDGNTPLSKTLENPIVMAESPQVAVPALIEVQSAPAAIEAPAVPAPVETPSLPADQAPQPEVPAKKIAQVSTDVIFANDSFDLSEENKAQIDQLIATFEDPNLNKIAIFAFNVEDGKDVFRKKRMSLNRAIEVRSYLLGKGYKNFSIKVINIAEENNKRNMVTIEELK